MNGEQGEDTEVNSGVAFPGDSFEPVLNSGLRVPELPLEGDSVLVVEFRANPKDKFAFRYKKETLVIGKCEWDGKRNVLRAICKCGVVRYCNMACLKKDIPYH